MLLDTSAWIEFFTGSEQGEKVKQIIKKQNTYTSIASIAEITNWALKQKQDHAKLLKTIEQLTTIINIDVDISTLAGELNFQRKKINKKWGMMDSFILATALTYKLNILTKDNDFKDLQNAKLL
jgi:predicted nucleic acid-binding protein